METSALRYNHWVSLSAPVFTLETPFVVGNKDLINAVISNSGQETCYEKVIGHGLINARLDYKKVQLKLTKGSCSEDKL